MEQKKTRTTLRISCYVVSYDSQEEEKLNWKCVMRDGKKFGRAGTEYNKIDHTDRNF